MNLNELDRYKLSDAVKFNARLNPKIWGKDEHLKPEVREALMKIAEDFRQSLGVTDLNLRDITVSGSNAAYTYTPHSDIDLHLVVDLPEADASEVYRELFDAKKYQYNNQHNYKIGGYDVELYVQNANEPPVSQGEYSLLNNDWIQVPRRQRADVVDRSTRSKYQDLKQRIQDAIKTKDYDVMANLMTKIKNLRKSGLDQHGEFGPENLAFKMLRTQGYIKQLVDGRNAAKDAEFSIDEQTKPRFIYGFGSKISEEKNSNLSSTLEKFAASCIKYLGIKKAPQLELHTDTDWSEKSGSFGQYDPESNVLHLATHGRHTLDILRTMAHEFTHRKQAELETLPPDAGETGSRWEDEANAMAGRIMRHWAEQHPEMFASVPLEEASGYIPKNKKEAQDPRFLMALTKDVRPGQTGREANKLGLQTDAQGRPALLTATLKESLALEYDRFGNQDPPGPEFKPTMPKGTVRVDVSDVYDWYKLGKSIANLARANPKDFGKGPPSTIVSFGDEDTEHKYIKGLEKLGLTTTDIDPVDPKQPPGMPRQKVDPTYNVAEAFDQPYALTWERGDHGDWSASAQMPDGNYIEILFTRWDKDRDNWDVEFYRNHSQDVTGEGDAMRVFATVMQAVRKFANKIRPGTVKLAATKDVEPGVKPESRARLYQRMAQRFAADMGYQVQVQDRGIQVNFVFTKQTPVAEGKIKLSTDPNWYGAEVNDYKATGPVVNIPVNQLVGFEPDAKMDQPASKANVEKIVAGLKQGAKLPPLLVRQYKNGYQVLDGHHRFWAYKLLGVKSIPAQVVPAEDIEEITKQGVAEGANRLRPDIEEFLNGLTPDDVGVEEFGPYRVHYEGFTDDCKSSSDYCENPEAVYQQVFRDFVKREGGAQPVDSGMVGDEDYPILYSVFKVKQDVAEDDLVESLRKEFEMLESQYITEIKMSPKNLRQEAAKTGAIAGMEFEMIVPNANVDDEPESEIDWDMDESVNDIDDACNFFHDGDYNGRRAIADLREEMTSQYEEWYDEKKKEAWDEEGPDYIRDWLWRTYEDEWRAEAEEEILADTPEFGTNNEELQQRIEEFVNEKWEAATEDVLANMGSDWDAAYEEWDEDWRGNNDLEQEWLRDQGWTTMRDIADHFDITWPYYTTPESSGTDINAVAEDFSDAVGMPVNASSSYHGGRREPGHYVVEPDGSLEPDDSADGGLEFVSPPMPIDELLDQLKKVKAWAGRYGCYTNESTGLHINISVPNYDLAKLDYVKLALLMGDEYVLDQFGRSSNTYAKSAMGKIKNILRDYPDKAQAVLDKMKGHMDDLATKAIHSGTTDKYTSINTKSGYIEFRSPGGDWLDANFDKVENTLLRFTVALSAAMDPAAYREEYLKKLYKLLSPKGEEDPISYFAKYSAGQLPKAALRSFVKQVQLQRKIKRGETGDQPMWWNVSWGNGRVEVVAKTQQEALDTAFRESYWAPDQPNTPEAQRFRASLKATPIRPYDQSPAKASVGEPQAIGRSSGATLNGRPSNPDGNYVITPEDDRSSVYYRFAAAGFDDANTVRRQWAQQHPDRVWVVQRDDNRTLGQPPVPGSTLDLQRQRAAQAPQQSAPQPLGAGRELVGWSVRLPDGREVAQIRGIGNNQGDANRIAADLLRQRGYGVSGEGFEVVPVWREA